MLGYSELSVDEAQGVIEIRPDRSELAFFSAFFGLFSPVVMLLIVLTTGVIRGHPIPVYVFLGLLTAIFWSIYLNWKIRLERLYIGPRKLGYRRTGLIGTVEWAVRWEDVVNIVESGSADGFSLDGFRMMGFGRGVVAISGPTWSVVVGSGLCVGDAERVVGVLCRAKESALKATV